VFARALETPLGVSFTIGVARQAGPQPARGPRNRLAAQAQTSAAEV
jgi:hypothetical protein